MSKPKPAYDEMIDLPDDPGETIQSDERTTERQDARTAQQLDDHTVTRSYDRTSVRKAADRKRASRAKAEQKPEPADYVQRSLYAREETFERLRQFAFKERRPAQELYREGLFLLLKKYGLAEGIAKPEDI